MQQRDQGKAVRRVILAIPENLRFMCQWVSDCSKTAFQKLSEPFLFTSLRFCLQRVDGKNRMIAKKDNVYKLCPIRLYSRHVANSLCKALRGFEDRMKVVILQ